MIRWFLSSKFGKCCFKDWWTLNTELLSHFDGLTDPYVILEGKTPWRLCGTISPFYWWENRSNWFAKVVWSAGVRAGTRIQVSRCSIFILSTAFMCVLQTEWVGKINNVQVISGVPTSIHIWFWGNKKYHLLSAYYVPGTVLCATYTLSLNPHNARVNIMPILRMRRVGICSGSQMVSGREGVWNRVWLLSHVLPSL